MNGQVTEDGRVFGTFEVMIVKRETDAIEP